MTDIRTLATFPDPRWDAFVADRAEATVCHLSEWAQVSQAMPGFEPHYLYAEDGGDIRGVLPLVHVTRAWRRGALVSTPFCVYGGAVATDADIVVQLEAAALALAGQLGVAYLEVRNDARQRADWHDYPLYARFRKPLDPDGERNLAAIPRKQRAMIRKGAKAGLTARTTRDVDEFYTLFCTGMRNLGTPVYGRRLFTTLLDVFGERCEILVCEHGAEPLAAVLSLYFRDEVAPYYAGAVPAARAVAAFDFLYWELMRDAAARGCRQFDFGRSIRDSGAFAFKKNWGFTPEPLHYQYALVRGPAPAMRDPARPLYRFLTAAWGHLPLAVANRLGPVLARTLY